MSAIRARSVRVDQAIVDRIFDPSQLLPALDTEVAWVQASLAYGARLLERGWTELGRGRHRVGFEHHNTQNVIKISRNPRGVRANLNELMLSQTGNKVKICYPWNGLEPVDVPIPKVLGHTRIGLLSILCVEWVERVDEEEAWELSNQIPWVAMVDEDNSGPQVGYTRDGRLVCFDWASM